MRSLLSSLLWRSWELKRWQILDWNTRISHGPTLEAPFSSILDPKPASVESSWKFELLPGEVSVSGISGLIADKGAYLVHRSHGVPSHKVRVGCRARQDEAPEGERCLLVLRWVVGVLCLANAQADGPTGKQPRRRSGSSLAEAEHARNRSSLQISSSGKLFGDPPEGGMVGRCCASCLRRCQSQDHIGWPFSASHRMFVAENILIISVRIISSRW